MSSLMVVRGLRPSENQHEGKRAKLRDMVAVEACQGRLWNTYIFSHRDIRNQLDSLTQDTKLCSKFTNSKWHHKFAKHNMTPRYVCILPIRFQKFHQVLSSLPPLADSCLSLSVSCSVAWPPFVSIGSLALWTTCSVPVPFSPCVAFWIYLPGFGPLVSLVGGLEWCYPC